MSSAPGSCEFLRTPRLVLRAFTEDDLEALLELDSDPEVMRYISDGKPRSREEEIGFLEVCLANHGPGLGYFAAEEGGEFVGWFHFRPDRRLPDEIEIGYRLKRAAWGRGLATEGSRALIEKGFAEGVRSITGRTMFQNISSARVLEKLGLEQFGEYQEDRWPGRDKRALLFRVKRGLQKEDARELP